MPAPKGGTLSLDDLLEVRFQSPIEFGLNIIEEVINREVEAHNRVTTDVVSTLADVTNDRRRIYGISETIEGVEADEFTRAHTQKALTGSVVEYPLRGYQFAIGWTQAFFENKSVADMAATFAGVQRGHFSSVRRSIQRSLFQATNYTFNDYRVDKMDLAVKRLVNADGADIPEGPNGETFNAATHTHYLATAALTNNDAKALVATVQEHARDPRPVIYINTADEDAWRALTDFKAYTDVRLHPNANVSTEPVKRLDPFPANDKPIGIIRAAEVWLKPWAITSYPLCIDTNRRPLAMRLRKGNTLGLKTAAKLGMFPLYAEYMESEFGFGAWDRTAAAVLYTAGGAYVDPASLA
jgi:hypothetical protein